MKKRNKERLKIAVYATIIVLYVFGFVLIFNFKMIFGIGYYHNEENFTTAYSGGSGGLNLKIFARHVQYNEHNYGIEITAFSTPDSDLIGITYLEYRLATDTVVKRILALSYSIPVPSYSRGYLTPVRTSLFQNDNLTCKGFADVIFKVNGINETYRITFDIGIFIELDGEEINYDANALTWINVIYLTCTVIPLTLLYRSIKKLKFLKWYSEEIKERDELFLKELRKKEKNSSTE